VERVDPRLIHSHHAINELIQIAQFRKYSHPQDSHDTLLYAFREPEYFRNKLDHAQKQSDNKKETATEKERLFITNINKGHKIIDLTRPNKLSTTTSKVATKSTGRTRL
jgi:hypothetical protein